MMKKNLLLFVVMVIANGLLAQAYGSTNFCGIINESDSTIKFLGHTLKPRGETSFRYNVSLNGPNGTVYVVKGGKSSSVGEVIDLHRCPDPDMNGYSCLLKVKLNGADKHCYKVVAINPWLIGTLWFQLGIFGSMGKIKDLMLTSSEVEGQINVEEVDLSTCQ